MELDPCISEIAKSWFEFKEDERMKVVIEDGLKFIQSKGLLLVITKFSNFQVKTFSSIHTNVLLSPHLFSPRSLRGN